MGDGGAGLHSRVLASGLRRLAHVVGTSGAVAVFLNQTRSRKPAAGGEEETSAGGPPLKLYACVRLLLDPRSDEQVVFRLLKNKVAAPFREGGFRRLASGEFTESP
jgi:RecA/RadA recombinase